MGIPVELCTPGHWYLIRSRNLISGVYRGDGAFIGVREKFTDRYLFTEFAPHTVSEIICDFGPCPVQELSESLGSRCGICAVPTEYQYFPDGKREITLPEGWKMEVPGEWVHLESTECVKPESHSIPNTELFEWLEEQDKTLTKEQRA